MDEESLSNYVPRGQHLSVKEQIGLFSYPDGAFRPITNDLTDHNSLSIAGDGHTLATVQKETSTQIVLNAAQRDRAPHARARYRCP